MHPNPAFAMRDELIARAAAIGFAHIFLAGPRPGVVHAPLTLHGDALRFHVARANRVADALDGADVVASVCGVDGYVSPNWYAERRDRVPTWNYLAIEIEGRCEAVDETGLVEQLDALAAAHEPRVNPADPWTRAKLSPSAQTAMLRAIRGFAITATAVRGTSKLSQNHRPADRDGAVAGLRANGFAALADAMAGVGAA